MNLQRLVLRNLFYHWRGNLAVLLGVVVGTAVLTGALLVGDSLRGSLRDLTLKRLGWVDQALIAGRFFREEVADKLKADRVSPVILLQGSAESGSGADAKHAGRISIYGVDDRFWADGQDPAEPSFWKSTNEEIVLSPVLQTELGVDIGGEVTLNVQQVSSVPRDMPFAERNTDNVGLKLKKLKVRLVLAEDSQGARFSLNPGPATPRNVFVPLRLLQQSLKQQGRVNVLLVGGGTRTLQRDFQRALDLEDWGLEVRIRKKHGYFSLESQQMFLELAAVEAAEKAAQDLKLRVGKTLVYLANRISRGEKFIPYSVVAALDPTLPPPLGPFLPRGEKLKPNQIILAAWEESPLKVKIGDKVSLTYFEPIESGRLRERTVPFEVHAFVKLKGVAGDPDLTPTYPGITDKEDMRSWDPPFPYDNKLIKPRDRRYWTRYRTTPKAYVTLTRGQELWKSRFGDLTSIRLAPEEKEDLTRAAKAFRKELMANLDATKGGMVFDDVRERNLEASSGSTDFGMLFLAFSVFLIVAALLLVGLLFRLNLDRRAGELGLLLATGYRRGTLRWLLLAEGVLLAIAGGLVGLVGAVLYAWLMLHLLGIIWPGGVEMSFLRLHVSWVSCAIGFLATFAMSLLTIAWATRVLGRVAPSVLLTGETTTQEGSGERRPPRWSLWIAGVTAVGAVVCLVVGTMVRDHEMQAGTFFGSGFLLLAAGLAGVWAWMRGSRHRQVGGHGGLALALLGVRNAARHPVRSLLTVGLLASATFLVAAVQSFHRDPDSDFQRQEGGSGGFPLLAETDVPIYQDLNSREGKDTLNNLFKLALQDGKVKESDRDLLEKMQFVPFRLKPGDDASCLNLAQPRKPRVLGVPRSLIQRGGFQFAESEADSDAEKANPWLLLDRPAKGGIVPVFGEANTVQWILKSKLGGELTLTNERGEPVKVRIVGLFKDSIFQSELLMSEKNFLELYPHQEGYPFFLVNVPDGQAGEAKRLLETVLADQGCFVQSTAERLALYLQVENTYLFTFQILGAFGLLLGALGLAIVLLRSVWERRGELALLRALGYRHSALAWLILAENSFLLVLGLAVGTITALVAVAPYLLAGSGAVPWVRLLLLVGLVLLVGLAAGVAAVASTLRAPLVPALRRE
jgi:ABC-type lipoprotein release transport system permease subunit